MSILLSGCSSWKNVPDKIDAFVGKAEMSAKEYTADDWELSKEEYDALILEYEDNIDKYSKEERALVTKAIGRYQTLMLLNGIDQAASVVNMFKELLPSYLHGVEDAVNERYDGIVDRAKGLLDFTEIEESAQSLEEELSNLAEEISEEIEER